jgi:glyoxylase I family protein
MAVHSIHHFNIRASKEELAVLRDFYCNVIGLTLGPRPPFRSSGFWLYAGGVAVLHLTVASEEESLPGVPDRRSAAGHIAFRCTDLPGALARLREHGIEHSVENVPLVNERQVFLRDPSGVGVELNFASSEHSVGESADRPL